MNTITLLLTSSQIERLYAAWSEFEVKAPAYARYQLKLENCTIKIGRASCRERV